MHLLRLVFHQNSFRLDCLERCGDKLVLRSSLAVTFFLDSDLALLSLITELLTLVCHLSKLGVWSHNHLLVLFSSNVVADLGIRQVNRVPKSINLAFNIFT